MKKILLMNDICCSGNVALTISLPIAKALQCDTDIIPTVLLSNHTAYQNVYKQNLTEEMTNILHKMQQSQLFYDAILTGYFYDAFQIQQLNTISTISNTLIVDPIMGDNGKLYQGIDTSYVEAMKQLCQQAELIIPNLTEACLLSNTPYPQTITETTIHTILKKLLKLGCRNVIISGIVLENQINVYYTNSKQTFKFQTTKIPGNYFGTGDLFSTLISVFYIQNKPFETCIPYAMEFVKKCIIDTTYEKEPQKGIVIQKQIQHLQSGGSNEQ